LITQLPLFPPSAHPPPTLFPLLSPLLQQKLGLLSLGRGRGWPGTLTWLPPDLSYRVNERLGSTCRSDGLGERLRGYRKFDQETILANIELHESELELWFSWVPEDGQTEAGWKLHDIRLPEHDIDLNWFESISEATMQWERENNLIETEIEKAEAGEQSDDDDSYWNQYDQVTGKAIETSEVRTPKDEPSIQTTSGDNYYDRYDAVEPALDGGRFPRASADIGSTGDSTGNSVILDRHRDIALEEYISDAVSSLWRLASRSGMSQTRFADLIKDGLD